MSKSNASTSLVLDRLASGKRNMQIEKGIWCRASQPKFICSDATSKKLTEVIVSKCLLGNLQRSAAYSFILCRFPIADFPFTSAMAGDNTQSPCMVVFQLLNRDPCFWWAENIQLSSLNKHLCRSPCKERPRLNVSQWWLRLLRQQGLLTVRCSRCHPLQGTGACCCSRHTCQPSWDLGLSVCSVSLTSQANFAAHAKHSAAHASTGGWWTQLKPALRVPCNASAAGDYSLKVYSACSPGPGWKRGLVAVVDVMMGVERLV